MEVGRLSQDELMYEVGVRGVVTLTTVDSLRKMLRNLMRLERSINYVRPDYPHTFEVDELAIRSKCEEIKDLIDQFSGTETSSEYKKLMTKLSHANNRANRSKPQTEEQRKIRSALLVRLVELATELRTQVRRLTRSSTLNNSIANISLGNAPVSTSESSDESSDQEAPSASVSARAAIKSVPVSQWRLKYTGDNKELSLGAFIERVGELRVARSISKEQLFKSALDLFSGKALIWFRAVRRTLSDWDELMVALREEFQPPDYDEQLFDEIRRRTQGPNESLSLYISIMTNLFSRLDISVPECNRIRIISKNMSPFYQSQLGLAEIRTLEDLRSMGRKLETRKAYVEAYVPPPRRNQTLEPDLACMTPSTSRTSLVSAVSDSRAGDANRKCWNCNQIGHRSSQCQRQHKIHCFKCGEPKFITRNCPKCNRSLNERRMR